MAEHVGTVIGLENQRVGPLEAGFHECGRMAQIRGKPQFHIAAPHDVAHRIGGVVRYAKTCQRKTVHVDGVARLKGLRAGQFPHGVRQAFQRARRGVDGNVQPPCQRAKTVDVVAMLVGDEDGREAVEGFAESLRTQFQLLEAQAAVNENLARFRGDEQRIASCCRCRED